MHFVKETLVRAFSQQPQSDRGQNIENAIKDRVVKELLNIKFIDYLGVKPPSLTLRSWIIVNDITASLIENGITSLNRSWAKPDIKKKIIFVINMLTNATYAYICKRNGLNIPQTLILAGIAHYADTPILAINRGIDLIAIQIFKKIGWINRREITTPMTPYTTNTPATPSTNRPQFVLGSLTPSAPLLPDMS